MFKFGWWTQEDFDKSVSIFDVRTCPYDPPHLFTYTASLCSSSVSHMSLACWNGLPAAVRESFKTVEVSWQLLKKSSLVLTVCCD